jgi:hypothetical protein
VSEITQIDIDMQNATEDGYGAVVRENAEIVVDNMLYDYRDKLYKALVQYEIDGCIHTLQQEFDYWLGFTRDNISLD